MFLHRYALAIGWPVPVLRKIMTSADIAEAMAFESLEPFGEYRDDLRSALIASTIANCNRGRGSKPYSLSDFMLRFGNTESKTVEDEIREAFGIGNNSS